MEFWDSPLTNLIYVAFTHNAHAGEIKCVVQFFLFHIPCAISIQAKDFCLQKTEIKYFSQIHLYRSL